MGGVLCAAAWLAGVALQMQQRSLWDVEAHAVLLLVAALGLFAARWLARGRLAALMLVAALAGFAIAGQRAQWRAGEALAAALEGQDLQVAGVIASLPQNNLAGTRFLLAVESASLRGEPVQLPSRLSLAWYRSVDADAMLSAPVDTLRAGQRWLLTVRLRQPHGNLNPQGFDYELWLWEQGIRATGYVRSHASAQNRKLADEQGYWVQRARQAVRDAIDRHVADTTAAGVLAALAIGDQAAIEREDWEIFRATGVAHLMSISGLHVTMFAWLAGLLIARVWRWTALLSPRPLLALAVPSAARWGGLFAATLYALVAGWGVPAQRTVWMIAAVVVLKSLGWRWPQPLVLAVAAVIVTMVDPWALMQPGFWLSFVAVALLIGSEAAWLPRPPAEGWRQRARALLGGGLRTQLVATVGLAPLSLIFFQQLSLVGFIANLVAIPLVTLLITPLALGGVLLPGLWVVGAALVQGLMTMLGVLAGWPWAVWTAAAAPAWAAAAGLVGGGLLIAPLPWRLRLLGLPMLLPLLAPPLARPPPGQFEAVVADVGQGTAVLVRTARHLLVYDAGPSYSAESDAGHRVLLPLLRARGEHHIDHLMLSHRDTDHVGGAASLLARSTVRSLSSSLEASHPLLHVGVAHEPCAAGQSWTWDGVRFELLHPPPGAAGQAVKPNTISCVLSVRGEGGSLLLTGDLEAAQEAALVQQQGPRLRHDVVVVPHHGSRTSSTPAFIEAIHPRVALVQAGYRSRFGHPAPDVVQRYLERGVAMRRSDQCGAWSWASAEDPRVHGVCERQRGARYWHHPAGHRQELIEWPSTSR